MRLQEGLLSLWTKTRNRRAVVLWAPGSLYFSPRKKSQSVHNTKQLAPEDIFPRAFNPRTRQSDGQTNGSENKATSILRFYPSCRVEILPPFTGGRILISKQRRPPERTKRQEGVSMGNIIVSSAVPFNST